MSTPIGAISSYMKSKLAISLPPTETMAARGDSGIGYLLIKLASQCNFDCTYCYWFRDGSMRELPALMSDEVITAFLSALERHITSNRLPEFVCSFHGGEPTLFGATKLRGVLKRLDLVAATTHCDIQYALTTNGSLLDRQWLDLIREFEIAVTVSIDGPPHIHDRRRLTVKGASTWQKSVEGYLSLCREGIAPTIIAVCDPSSDPVAVLDHFAKDLGVQFCDVLVPDCNHMEGPESISSYYIQLFDHWYDNYSETGPQIRILTEIVRSLLGLQSRTDSIGFGPTQTVCLSPTGVLEPHDVLRIAGKERVATQCSIFTHEIADIETNPVWLSVRDASTNLCAICETCRYRNACGGGHIAQRWSTEREYDNPSVYCSDFIRIFDHIAERLSSDLNVNVSGSVTGREVVFRAITGGNPASIFTPELLHP